MPVIIDGTLGVNAAAITTTNWTPTNITTGGNTTLGDASADTVTINAGTTTIASVGARIKADFSNSTLSNRVAFQTSAVNNNTAIIALPSGTNTISSFRAMASSDADNAAQATLRIDGSEVQLRADTSGTASYLPITFYTSGLERMRLNTGGGINISGGALFLGATGGEGGELQFSGVAGGNSFMIDVGPSDIVRLIQNANQPMQFHTNSLERMRIDASGNVGIGGLGVINGKFSVLTSGSFNATGDSISTGINFVGPNYAFNSGGNPALFNVESNTTAGIDVGATIGLGGQYNTATQKAQFAIIKAAKENATNDNYATYLAFGTRAHGANIQERMRIDSAGKVGIGKNNPGTTLDVAGTIQAVHSLSGAFAYRVVADSTNTKGGIQFTNNAANTDYAYLEAKSPTHVTWRTSAGADANQNNCAFGINGGPVGIRDIVVGTGDAAEASDWPVASLSIASYDSYTANTMMAFLLKDDTNYMTDISKWNFRLYHAAQATTSDSSVSLGLGGPGNLYLQANGAGGIQFTTNGGERLRIPYNATGIQFPATQVASTDPNTLDDYEEGDWTPAFATNATQPTGVTYDTSLTKGRYTKIGRIVYVRGTIVMTSKGTGGTGNAYITMPFASANYGGYAYQAFPTFMYYSSGLPRTMYLAVYDQNSTAYLATNADAASVVDWSVLSNNEKFSFSGTYQV